MSQKHVSVISGGITGRTALLAACLAAAAQARTYSINTTNMGFVNDGSCGLTEAIDAINTQSARWGCPGPDGTDDAIFLQGTTYTATVGLTLNIGVSINCPVGTCIVDAGNINTNLITLSNSNPAVFINDLTIRQSSGNTNNINGLKVLGGTLNLYHTTVTGFRLAGVSIQIGNTHTISRSTFTGNGYGLYLSDGTGLASEYNTISNNWQGIRAGNVSSFGDLGSVISDNADAGLELPNGGSLSWKNTTISRNRNRGIHMGTPGSLFYLTGCTIDGNTTPGDGAGLYVIAPASGANSEVDIKSSTISNNRAQGDGGGIYSTSTVLLTNCTVSNDTARRGGGAFTITVATNSYLTFTRSTVAFNHATDSGGGLYFMGYGVSADHEKIGVINSIVAKNTARLKYPDMFGATSGDYSLFGDWTGSTGHTNDFPPADPLLGPLMDNAGPIHVKTRALLKGSPAIDKVEHAYASENWFDSRGLPRPPGTPPGAWDWDLGAYEAGPFETELLDVIGQSADDHRVQYESGLSNGAGTVLRADAVGDYVTYAVAIPEPGTYDIDIRAKVGPNRPIVELATAPGTTTFTTIGTVDLYASSLAYRHRYPGSFTFTSAGIKYFRLKVIGRNVSSTGFLCYYDYINITKQ